MASAHAKGSSRGRTALAAAALAASAIAAYANSFGGPFIYDDVAAIPENPTIRHLWPLGRLLSPPPDSTVGGRPMLEASFALNYALGGVAVAGYHAVNLGIHLLAALALFGLCRRTLVRIGTPDALPLAFCVALIWAVHPLQTESVTYMVQRAESLMGLCYLGTLYCCMRGMEEGAPRAWMVAGIAACLAGMASKEVMASAPLVVLLYDRTFAAGSFRAAWRRRKGLYAALAATWIPLLGLIAGLGWNRSGTVGIGVRVSWLGYESTQFEAMCRYLGLSLWPSPLVFNNTTWWVGDFHRAAPYAPFVLALLAFSIFAAARNRPAGFLGAWFFAILAPTSLMPGISQTIVEHRMYLPLAAVVTVAIMLGHRLAGRRIVAAVLPLAAALGFLTAHRNRAYASAVAIWGDTVAKCPADPVPRGVYAYTLFQAGLIPESLRQYREALRLKPNSVATLNDYGTELLRIGRAQEALPPFEAALRIKSDDPGIRTGLGMSLLQTGRIQAAIEQLEQAVRIAPDNVMAQNNLGVALLEDNRPAEAVGHFQAVVRADPSQSDAHRNLCVALVQAGRFEEARAEYQEARK